MVAPPRRCWQRTTRVPGGVEIGWGLASGEWQSWDLNPGLPDLEPLLSPNCPLILPTPTVAPDERRYNRSSEEWPTHALVAPSTPGGYARLGKGQAWDKRLQQKVPDYNPSSIFSFFLLAVQFA